MPSLLLHASHSSETSNFATFERLWPKLVAQGRDDAATSGPITDVFDYPY